jgi:hypothetical protein
VADNFLIKTVKFSWRISQVERRYAMQKPCKSQTTPRWKRRKLTKQEVKKIEESRPPEVTTWRIQTTLKCPKCRRVVTVLAKEDQNVICQVCLAKALEKVPRMVPLKDRKGNLIRDNVYFEFEMMDPDAKAKTKTTAITLQWKQAKDRRRKKRK